jgi:NADH:ubiquinone oxidoreductase subunit 2 (subunit N)
LRVIVAMYMGEAEDSDVLVVGPPTRTVLVAAMAVTLLFGLLPAPLLRLAGDALPL